MKISAQTGRDITNRSRRRPLPLALLCLLALLTNACTSAPPAPAPDSRAPLMLSIDELFLWSLEGPLADDRHRSTVPLAPRLMPRALPGKSRRPHGPRVLIAPDGIDSLDRQARAENRFNHYVFTQWAYVDVLNWFGGTADANINIPARAWVEAAHQNGVKVIGTVFFAPKAWGGKPEQALRLIERDPDGTFPAARQLVRIASYYGFDGWLINQETDLDTAGAKVGDTFADFMAALTALRPEGMEIHWYDAMLPDGKVNWQNELNPHNVRYLQDGKQRTSDAMFVNYWWSERMVANSVATAHRNGRSQYDVFMGADLWPGRDAQALARQPGWLEMLSGVDDELDTSIALFANHYNFSFDGAVDIQAASDFARDERDVQSFYASANRLITGDDGNIATPDVAPGWPGLARFFDARPVIGGTSFTTCFSTGHGRIRATRGDVAELPWHDLAQQDLLPTWQFAVQGNRRTQIRYDFDRAYEKGNALRIEAMPAEGAADIPLFATAIEATGRITVSVAYLNDSGYDGATIYLATADGERRMLPLPAGGSAWQERADVFVIESGNPIITIGVSLPASDRETATLLLGRLSVSTASVEPDSC